MNAGEHEGTVDGLKLTERRDPPSSAQPSLCESLFACRGAYETLLARPGYEWHKSAATHAYVIQGCTGSWPMQPTEHTQPCVRQGSHPQVQDSSVSLVIIISGHAAYPRVALHLQHACPTLSMHTKVTINISAA